MPVQNFGGGITVASRTVERYHPNAAQSVSSLISTTGENGYFSASLAGLIGLVFEHVTTGVAVVGFSLHDSCNV